MNHWPAQADCDAFYGNPRGGNGGASRLWESNNLVRCIPPWKMIDEDSRHPVSGIEIHRKCLASLSLVLENAWALYGKSQAEIERHSLHISSGSYVFRNIRGGVNLSMHSYGCALDLASGLNALGEPYNPQRGLPVEFVQLFEAEGWTWGGRWTGRPDAMHFQAATVHRGDVAPSATPVLKRGDRGIDVARLQKLLAIEVDGDFGPQTSDVVIDFQKSHSLTADGVVGAATWSKLA